MVELLISFIVLVLILTWGLLPVRSRRENSEEVLPFAASPPHRGSTGIALLVVGPLLMIAGFLVIVWPEAASECHGSPVCGIGAIGKFVHLVVGSGLMIGGLSVLIVGAFRSSR